MLGEEFLDFIVKQYRDALARLKFDLQKNKKGDDQPMKQPKLPDRFLTLKLNQELKDKINKTQ